LVSDGTICLLKIEQGSGNEDYEEDDCGFGFDGCVRIGTCRWFQLAILFSLGRRQRWGNNYLWNHHYRWNQQ
jgi:hypothetical protein